VVEILQSGCFTALFYLNPVWQLDWHGETILYDDETQDTIHCCVPRGGRLLLFDSRIWHGATSPSMICPEMRLTLALKLRLGHAEMNASGSK